MVIRIFGYIDLWIYGYLRIYGYMKTLEFLRTLIFIYIWLLEHGYGWKHKYLGTLDIYVYMAFRARI